MSTLEIDVRTSLRAAVAVALATGVAYLFSLQRSYWVITVAVVVLAETWGASIQKALQRVMATAAGCIIGWGVARLAGTSEWVAIGLLLVCVFLAIYHRGYSYPWMMFWITIYVVFLFSLLGEWNARIAYLRLIDTLIGGCVAIVATVIIRPAKANQLHDDLVSIWSCAHAQLAASLATLVPIATAADQAERCSENLYQEVEALRAHVALAPYENILRPRTVGRIREIVQETEALGRQVLALSLLDPGSGMRLRPVEAELGEVARLALSSLHRLAGNSSEPLTDVPEACRRLDARAADAQRSGEMGTNELLLICILTSHLARAGRAVDRILELRRGLPANAEVPRPADMALA